MKRGSKRFALYRTKDDPEGRRIRGRPYRDIKEEKQNINTDHYRRTYMGEYLGHESLKELMVKIRIMTKDALSEPIGTSDVLMLNRDGEPLCYYIDGESLKLITQFIRPSSGGTAIDDHTKGAAFEGKTGKWDTVDSVILDGRIYYLMENQKYRERAEKIVADADGKLLLDDVPEGFNPTVNQQIRDIVKQTSPPPVRDKSPGLSGQDKDTDMLIWQRPYENGTWERRAESGTESNYDMVDGRVNNQAEADPAGKVLPSGRMARRGRRKSVIQELRNKQIRIARESGKPIPAYLQKEERDRKG